MFWICIEFGCNLRYTILPVTEIVKEFARIRPTIIPFVPRLLNKLYPVIKAIY